MLVSRLLDIQNRLGYLPDQELRTLASEAGVPLYRVEEVASFFPVFRREWDRPAALEVKVCRDMTCHLRGAGRMLAEDGLPLLAAELEEATGQSVRIQGTSCLGRCDRAPVAVVEHQRPGEGPGRPAYYCGRNPAQLSVLLRWLATGNPAPAPDTDLRYLPHTNCSPGLGAGGPQAWEIDPYANDGLPRDYLAARRCADALREGNVGPFLEELKASGLAGMGGAGAPAYGKWSDVRQQPGPEKYVVANGDESEPGTFKDRELMLRFPHLIVEGLVLAGLLTGASAGYVYIRHEYHEQIAAVREEIARAAQLGACGENVFGTGRRFPVEVFEKPGGYICGEQSALLEAMEDRRAQPRNRPPELGSNGLRDKPTIVNNVETLAWAPYIFLRGGAAYVAAGWQAPGTDGRVGFGGRRLFSVSGDVVRPGVYEVPVGMPLGELLLGAEYCGGIKGGKALKAVATSGPSGGLLPARLPAGAGFREKLPDSLRKIRERSPADAECMEWFLGRHLPAGSSHLDLLTMPLDLNFFRYLHSALRLPVEPMLGAGIVAYAEGTDTLEQAVNFTRFYRNESCGKCVPCRIGSQKLHQLGTSLLERRAREVDDEEVALLREEVLEVSQAMQQTSICGLGYVAPLPISSALTYFADEVVRAPKAVQ